MYLYFNMSMINNVHSAAVISAGIENLREQRQLLTKGSFSQGKYFNIS